MRIIREGIKVSNTEIPYECPWCDCAFIADRSECKVREHEANRMYEVAEAVCPCCGETLRYLQRNHNAKRSEA